MNLVSEHSRKIEAALNSYAANPEPDIVNLDPPLDMRKHSAKLNFLPMTFEMGGCYGIRPDGAIVFFTWDEPYKLEIENEPRLRNMVLFQGAKKYPELKELVPARSPGSIECPHCEGTGIIQEFAEHGFIPENIVCYCGSMGWLP